MNPGAYYLLLAYAMKCGATEAEGAVIAHDLLTAAGSSHSSLESADALLDEVRRKVN